MNVSYAFSQDIGFQFNFGDHDVTVMVEGVEENYVIQKDYEDINNEAYFLENGFPQLDRDIIDEFDGLKREHGVYGFSPEVHKVFFDFIIGIIDRILI